LVINGKVTSNILKGSFIAKTLNKISLKPKRSTRKYPLNIEVRCSRFDNIITSFESKIESSPLISGLKENLQKLISSLKKVLPASAASNRHKGLFEPIFCVNACLWRDIPDPLCIQFCKLMGNKLEFF